MEHYHTGPQKPTDESDQKTINDDLTRRQLLASGAAAGAAGLTTPLTDGGVVADAGDREAHPEVPTTPEEIRAAFRDVPRLDDPDPGDRVVAEINYPDVVVPADGAIPDPYHGREAVTIEAPPWVLASVYDRLQHADQPSVGAVRDLLLDQRSVYEEWVTPSGRDATYTVLGALRESGLEARRDG